jgi:hypothetical protein
MLCTSDHADMPPGTLQDRYGFVENFYNPARPVYMNLPPPWMRLYSRWWRFDPGYTNSVYNGLWNVIFQPTLPPQTPGCTLACSTYYAFVVSPNKCPGFASSIPFASTTTLMCNFFILIINSLKISLKLEWRFIVIPMH